MLDFEPIIQNYGDVINTRRIGEFTAMRKSNADPVTVQDATAVNVQVTLSHHVHVSFLIKDGEETTAVTSLVDEYMAPAMIAQARYVDRVLLGQTYRFMRNMYGHLGNLTTAEVVPAITNVRQIMNINKAPMQGRYQVLTPPTETIFLQDHDFVDAARIGDDGTALREANLGRLYGFNHFAAQNAPSVTSGNTVAVGAVNLVAGYLPGATTLVVDNFTGLLLPGSWLTIAGDDAPQRVISSTATLGNATGIVISPGLLSPVLDDAPVIVYTPGAVNLVAGYAAGWPKEITVDGFTIPPRMGQLVSFGTNTDYYTIIDVNGIIGITLDRPLDSAISNNEIVGIGPAGEYNLAFLRNAIALVVRPLATPRPGTGALSSVVNLNGLSMRATLTYDGNAQGTLVTLDMLMGVQVLNDSLGAILLG